MKRIVKHAALLSLVLLTATACPRQVQVESEPDQPDYMQSSAAAAADVDMVGVYDYVVDMGGEEITGPMTVTRSPEGAYAVSVVMDNGERVVTRNVRRDGNDLNMDIVTPDGGSGTVMLEWMSADEVEGEVFIGETLRIHATRRP